MLPTLFSLYLKMLVLYSPFFVLSCFISLTRGYTVKERKRLAWKVAIGTLISGDKPSAKDMFEDVFAEMPPHLVEQRQQAGI